MEQSLLSNHGWDDTIPPPEKPGYLALSRTTDRVLQILLGGDLARLRADSVAESLGMSSTTLRRRLRADHTCYQFLLDRARQYRCEQVLRGIQITINGISASMASRIASAAKRGGT